MKEAGGKIYHAYLSDDVYQDQDFVNIVLDKMFDESKLEENETIVIESNDCTSQYKSAEHFDGLVIANKGLCQDNTHLWRDRTREGRG